VFIDISEQLAEEIVSVRERSADAIDKAVGNPMNSLSTPGNVAEYVIPGSGL
jgi:hypothetical protein